MKKMECPICTWDSLPRALSSLSQMMLSVSSTIVHLATPATSSPPSSSAFAQCSAPRREGGEFALVQQTFTDRSGGVQWNETQGWLVIPLNTKTMIWLRTVALTKPWHLSQSSPEKQNSWKVCISQLEWWIDWLIDFRYYLGHTVMKAKLSHSLPSASWKLNNSSDAISPNLKTWEAGVPYPRAGGDGHPNSGR